MKKQRNYSQLKEQTKLPKTINTEMEINNLPGKELKTLVIKMLTELGKRIYLNSEHFNKEPEDIKKIQSEMNNSIAELKKTY